MAFTFKETDNSGASFETQDFKEIIRQEQLAKDQLFLRCDDPAFDAALATLKNTFSLPESFVTDAKEASLQFVRKEMLFLRGGDLDASQPRYLQEIWEASGKAPLKPEVIQRIEIEIDNSRQRLNEDSCVLQPDHGLPSVMPNRRALPERD